MRVIVVRGFCSDNPGAVNPMQILVINQFFWPDTAATGQLLTDVTRGWIRSPRGDGVVRNIRLWRGGYELAHRE